jgi:large subunit ribosomal protein L20
MPRVKRGVVRRQKRKKLSKLTKGYFQNKSKLYKFMREAAEKAGVYAYVGRKQKKRDYRSLWIVRINAAAREHGISYSVLMNGLKAAGVTLDRKSLAELAAREPAAFAALVDQAKAARPTPAA